MVNGQPVAGMYLGTMSGTSLDGIDMALVQIDEEGCILTSKCHSVAFSKTLHHSLKAFRSGEANLHDIAETEQRFTHETANAINQWFQEIGVVHSDIKALGFHGQTLWHQPEGDFGYSWQLGSAARLAALTQLDIVHDFRSADISSGGQGAPLAPAFHHAVFRCLSNPNQKIAGVLNLGGFANLTLMSDQPEQVMAGDTGPANTLTDAWYQLHFQDSWYDPEGQWGQSGKLLPDLLNQWLMHPYLKQPFPKSTGFEVFNLDWLKNSLKTQAKAKPEDVQRTLYQFSVQSIAQSIQHYRNEGIIVVCGGGVHNRFLLELLSEELGDAFQIRTSSDFELPCDGLEACAFAWLAHRFVSHLPGNLPSVTGAKQPTILGSWTPKPLS